MGLLDPSPTPYDPLEWRQLPFPERARQVCQAWALQGYGTPVAAYLAYAIKVVLFILAWMAFCSVSLPFTQVGEWWASDIAFQKAMVWSMLFEGLGFGCGSGPLTGRYYPPVGGFLYFLRPGTTKLPLLDRWRPQGSTSLWAKLCGPRRTWIDVLVYAALVGWCFWVLLSPVLASWMFIPALVLIPLIALLDRTIVLALRAEHYAIVIACFALARDQQDWIAGAKCVQLALWFWAGVSKLNRHFPAVVCVMTSNSPFTRFEWMRRLVYKSYPEDLRPSRVAVVLAHVGTLLELGVPMVLLASPWLPPWGLVLGLCMMVALHVFITSNVPMGVPIEWNFVVVYGAFVLFGVHSDVLFEGITPGLGILLILSCILLPIFGNLMPGRLSFLLSMRYYAGNWAYGVWMFKDDAYRKLDRLTKSAPWIYDQLDHFYDRATSIGLVGKVLAFRLMHLHGRALPELIPRAVPRFEDVEYLDGEVVAGLVLGWNFGDGHLHREALLRAVQEQCGFEEGELRCIFVESQPVGRGTLSYRICDAASGEIESGSLKVRDLEARQPWEASTS